MEVFEVIIALLLGGAAELFRHRYALQLRRAEEQVAHADGGSTSGVDDVGPDASTAPDLHAFDDDAAVVRVANEAQRRTLLALRADGTIGDLAFQRVEEELDWTELSWAQVVGHRE